MNVSYHECVGSCVMFLTHYIRFTLQSDLVPYTNQSAKWTLSLLFLHSRLCLIPFRLQGRQFFVTDEVFYLFVLRIKYDNDCIFNFNRHYFDTTLSLIHI